MSVSAIYPRIGGNTADNTRLFVQTVDTSVIDVPTAIPASVTAVIAGIGYVGITLNGTNMKLLAALG